MSMIIATDIMLRLVAQTQANIYIFCNDVVYQLY